jgi:hypothetical protein
MSDITYIALQGLILICYASWIFYRIGYGHGQQSREEELRNEYL